MALSNSDYSAATKGLDDYGSILCSLIKELLLKEGVQALEVTHRVKGYKSAFKKINLNSDRYTKFSDLDDLLGVRVITYFPKDVDKAGVIFSSEFKVDQKNSVDKREVLEFDRFGYRSLHYVASLSIKRKRLIEYGRFSSMRFELQIRTVLQHAWAEIEHDLGYKTESALPDNMKRSFFRLAGLLELADEEFERIREELGDYEKEVSNTIKTSPEKLKIDQSTILAAVRTEKVITSLDKAICKAAERELDPEIRADFAVRQGLELKIFGINDLGSLLKISDEYKEHIVKFADYWFKRDGGIKRSDVLSRGIGLFYLGYVLAAQSDESDLTAWRTALRAQNKGILSEVKENWEKVVLELGKPRHYKEILIK